jgi:nucleoside-diphosphate-sugar epimerase
MTVFGYLTREPYLSIFNNTFDDATMLKDLRKLTVADDPPLPDIQTPGNTAYCQSKIICEQMAMDIVKNNSISIICVRFGGVEIDDRPATTWIRTVWFSHRDACSFIDKALQAPLNISGIYFAISNNHRLWVDLGDAERDLGYVPQDGTEKP